MGRFVKSEVRLLWPLYLVAVSMICWTGSAKDLRVVVNASADEEYVERSKDSPIQTYHFYEGAFLSGKKRDPSLKKLAFQDIAQTAAEFLKTRDFIPAQSKDAGDLLILLTWGNTSLDNNYIEDMGITDWDFSEPSLGGELTDPVEASAAAEGAAAEAELSSQDWTTQGPGSYFLKKNIQMLGFDKGLYNRKTPDTEREKLRLDLKKDRYFIVFNAFDLPHLRETGEYKQLWSCRVSIQNVGTNFVDALKIMNSLAAPTFGTNIDNLMVAEVDPRTDIQFGELQVLGTEEE